MNLLAWIKALFGSGEAKGPLTVLIERLIPDADGRAKAKEEFEKLLLEHGQKSELAQLDVNKAEAQHASIFVAGWRPFIGWVCGFGLAWQYILQPLLTWVLGVVMAYQEMKFPDLPKLQTGELMTLLLGMLGLAGYRTWEKVKGEVDRSSMNEP